MNDRKNYEHDGLILRRRLVSVKTVARLVGIGERVHAQWLLEQGEEARRLDFVNSTGLTATRYFRPPFDAQRQLFFDALANEPLWYLLTSVFGDELYFHGTQMFFNPLGGRRRPYWHRDIQYMPCGEREQQALLRDLCHLHIRFPLRPERKFMLIPGSHARWDTEPERDVRLERSGHESYEDLPSAMPFDLYPGDVLIFSAHMLHRGTYEGNNARLSLDLMLGKPHRHIPFILEPDQLPTIEELATLRRPQWYEHAHELLRQARSQ
jgi:hypothetical protein